MYEVIFICPEQDVQGTVKDLPTKGEKIILPEAEDEFVVRYVCRSYASGFDDPLYVATLDPWTER